MHTMDEMQKQTIPQRDDYSQISNNGVHNLCFVCGGSNAFKELRIQANSDNMNEPYFPFLQCHSAPKGVPKIISTQLYVMACILCYHSLLGQWNAYNRDKKPHLQRIYHLKRCDGKSYIGADIQTQGEYASQILGLNTENLPQSGINLSSLDLKNEDQNSLAYFNERLLYTIKPSAKFGKERKEHTHKEENDNIETIQNVSNKSQQLLIYNEECHPSENALNLCNSSTICSSEQNVSSTFLTAEVGILDLSMPDKNSTTEVCYVCGKEQRRGSLKELKTVKTKDSKGRNSPYFPIFNEHHPRPARSRPKDPHGRIQACIECFEYLLGQWNNHEEVNTPEIERSYALRLKSPNVLTDKTNFTCYACGMITIKAHLCLISHNGNADQKQIYSILQSIKPTTNLNTLTAKVSEDLQICNSCYKKYIHYDNSESQLLAKLPLSKNVNDIPVQMYKQLTSDCIKNHLIANEHIRFKPYEVEKKTNVNNCQSNLQLMNTSTQTLNDVDYSCYICKKLCTSNDLEWLYTSAEHMNSHAMHFPCLNRNVCDDKNDKRNGNTNENVTLDANDLNNNRVLACKSCVSHLAHQWDKMDAERVPLEHRRYTIPYTSSSISSENKSNANIRPSSTPSSQSTTSIYCFLCGLHSDLILARILYASKEGSRPFFPHLLTHKSPTNAEQLRNDFSALVCTFCYHSLMKQWHKYEEQNPNKNPMNRKYNWHDYICHLCGITTYRKRVRALPVNEFPFVKNRKNDDGLLLENGEYAAVCLDCYESLRQQSFQHDRFGVPISKRAYNWVPQPPPPEDSPDVSVARLPCGGRADGKNMTSTRQNLKRANPSKDAPSNLKCAPKRPTLSPKPGQPSSVLESSRSGTDDVIVSAYQSTPSTSQSFFTAALKNLAKQADYGESGAIDQLLPGNHEIPKLSMEKKVAQFDGGSKISTGFQPYKTNEHLQHLSTLPPSHINSYTTLLNNYNTNKFVTTPNFPYYSDQFYCNVPRVANSLYAPIMPYISPIYGIIPPPALPFPLDSIAYHHSNTEQSDGDQTQKVTTDEMHKINENNGKLKKKSFWKDDIVKNHAGYGLYNNSDQHTHLSMTPYHNFESREQTQIPKADNSLSYQIQPKSSDSNQLSAHQGTSPLSSSGLNTSFSIENSGIQSTAHMLHYHQHTPFALYPANPISYNFIDTPKASLIQHTSSAPPSIPNSYSVTNTDHFKSTTNNRENIVTSLHISKESKTADTPFINTPINLTDKITEKKSLQHNESSFSNCMLLNQSNNFEKSSTIPTKENFTNKYGKATHDDGNIPDEIKSQDCD